MSRFSFVRRYLLLLSAVGSMVGVGVTGLVTVCHADPGQNTVEVGKAAPDITMTGIDGKDFKLSEITGSGKNVALMFSRAHW